VDVNWLASLELLRVLVIGVSSLAKAPFRYTEKKLSSQRKSETPREKMSFCAQSHSFGRFVAQKIGKKSQKNL
jgi:hypothetical protein